MSGRQPEDPLPDKEASRCADWNHRRWHDGASTLFWYANVMRPGGLHILLLRHADAVKPGTLGYGTRNRPLSEIGFRQAEEMAHALDGEPLVAICSSPYVRARQTVEPLALRRGLVIETIADLREQDFPEDASGDWRAEAERSFRDFDHAPFGGETSRAAQARVVDVMGLIATRHTAGTVVLASHGNLITLALAAIEPSISFSFFSKMPLPAVYRLRSEGDGWRIVSGPNIGPSTQY
jgi:2,3-bisphosphoglycerate-dependent phosphoglycerate mutase